jgi:hypothetical protein
MKANELRLSPGTGWLAVLLRTCRAILVLWAAGTSLPGSFPVKS